MIPNLPVLFHETSFEDIDTTTRIYLIVTRQKDTQLKIGQYMHAKTVDRALESYTLAMFTRYGDWKPAEVEQ